MVSFFRKKGDGEEAPRNSRLADFEGNEDGEGTKMGMKLVIWNTLRQTIDSAG